MHVQCRLYSSESLTKWEIIPSAIMNVNTVSHFVIFIKTPVNWETLCITFAIHKRDYSLHINHYFHK